MSQRMLSSVTSLPPVPTLSAMPLWRMLSGKGVCGVRVVSQNEFKLEVVHALTQSVKGIDLLAFPFLRDCNGWEREHEGRAFASRGTPDGITC